MTSSSTIGPGRPRVAFVLEQTLGHITHASNLRRLVPLDDRIDARFCSVTFPTAGSAARVPGYRNWTVQAGLRARHEIGALRREAPLEALFVHTQVPAILLGDVMRRIPTVVSLDATPLQYDELGDHYGHATGNRTVERAKWWLNRACFRRAAAIVTWAEWTKIGLVESYEVSARKVTVIPPGVDVARWTRRNEQMPDGADGTLRVLFVGGDFERKGGATLLAAAAQLRDAGRPIELDIVTRDPVPLDRGVRVHRGLEPNSAALIRLYEQSDVFCLPTRGDCLPMVLSEAAAMELPLVATDVGAIREIVRDDVTGLLVPVDDAVALAAALDRLAADADLRSRLGRTACDVTHAGFDAAANARRLVDTILSVI